MQGKAHRPTSPEVMISALQALFDRDPDAYQGDVRPGPVMEAVVALLRLHGPTRAVVLAEQLAEPLSTVSEALNRATRRGLTARNHADRTWFAIAVEVLS